MVDALTVLAVLVLMTISFGLGTTLTLQEFKLVVKQKPKSLLIAIFLQYLVMPPFLYGIYKLSDATKEQGVGMMLVGVAPGSVSANLITYLTKGDVALSIVATSVATLTAMGMIPLLLFIYVDQGGLTSAAIKVDYVTVVVTGLVLLLPALVGAYLRHKSPKWAKRVEKACSVVGLIFLIAAVIVGVSGETHIFSASGTMWAAAWLLQIWGTVVGYFVGWVARCSHKDMRVIGIITGIQNTTIALSIASLNFDDSETRKRVLVYVLLETFCYLINCIIITIVFRFMSRYDTKADDDVVIVPDDETQPDPTPVPLQSPSASNSQTNFV